MTLCEKITVEMEARGIKKSELAESIGVPYTTLDSMLRRNSDNIRISVLYKIARYFGVSVYYLIFDYIFDSRNEKQSRFYQSRDCFDNTDVLKKLEKLNEDGLKLVSAYIDGLLTDSRYLDKTK